MRVGHSHIVRAQIEHKLVQWVLLIIHYSPYRSNYTIILVTIIIYNSSVPLIWRRTFVSAVYLQHFEFCVIRGLVVIYYYALGIIQHPITLDLSPTTTSIKVARYLYDDKRLKITSKITFCRDCKIPEVVSINRIQKIKIIHYNYLLFLIKINTLS